MPATTGARLTAIVSVIDHHLAARHAATVLDLGNDAVQGYPFGRPAPLADVLALALRDA